MGDNQAHPSYYLSMRIFSRFRVKVFVFAALLLCAAASAVSAAELHVPAVAGASGEVVKLPVTVDKVDNLAGIKLVMTYDRNILKFIKAEKSAFTTNMLYVVNDKTPGRLIIVMAAAKGFKGENAPLVEISFELLQVVKREANITVQIIEAELMNDKLQKIEINPQ